MPQSSKRGLQQRRVTPKPLVLSVSSLSQGCLSSDPLDQPWGFIQSCLQNNLSALVEVFCPTDPLTDTLRVLPASCPDF